MDGHHGYPRLLLLLDVSERFWLPLLASFGIPGVITVVSELTFRRLRDKRAGTAAREGRPQPAPPDQVIGDRR